ncbi:PD-(D/E)XK motif protein [Nostoc sp. CALU 546]|uniref:PD-(D/E)XK motif protein n=1 Tax=Nostoc sp. CALU 546 TaxID=1867241 RepID=UPI003B67F482
MIVQDTWELLENDTGALSSGYLTRRLIPELNYDVFLAIEQPSNTRLFMLRIKHISVAKGIVFPKSSSFEVRRVALPNDNEAYVTIQLLLTNYRYKDIFTTLVQDIVTRLASLVDEKDAVAEFITRLQRWQAFLEKHKPEGLNRTQQQGLYGELWFLRHIVIPKLGSHQGIQSWTGPKGTQQDFQFINCAIEVKTTVEKQHQKLIVNSERQLDDTGIGRLFILHLSLDARQGRGESLPKIVNSIRILVENDPIASEALETLLFEVGYLDIHIPYYKEISYTQREINYFKVQGDFPRIVESDLRNGIGNVNYTISVAECKRFSITELDVISEIRCNDE